MEGEFRACHTNIHHHSEEIAFYRGDNWERKKVNENFGVLYDHSLSLSKKRSNMGIFDSMLIKYGAVMLGYAVLGIPVFGKNKEDYLASIGDASNITRDYIKNASLLISLAKVNIFLLTKKALGRIVISYKEIQELAGYTTLVHEIKDVMDDVRSGNYSRHFPNPNKNIPMKVNKKGEVLVPMGNGKVQTDNKIMLADVPLWAPNGDELGNHISILMEKGQSCLVVGPNGCGKTSLFRILAGVWPIFQGSVIRPSPSKVFFLPQRAYLPKGTLRDLIIYPHLKSQKTDEVNNFCR